MPRPNPDDHGKAYARLERNAKALAMRKAGVSVANIAASLGLNRVTVHKILRKQLTILAEDLANEREHLRALFVSRYEAIVSANWSAAVRGPKDGGPDKDAIDALLKSMKSLRELLGTDEPTKSQVENIAAPVFILPPATAAEAGEWLADSIETQVPVVADTEDAEEGDE